MYCSFVKNQKSTVCDTMLVHLSAKRRAVNLKRNAFNDTEIYLIEFKVNIYGITFMSILIQMYWYETC